MTRIVLFGIAFFICNLLPGIVKTQNVDNGDKGKESALWNQLVGILKHTPEDESPDLKSYVNNKKLDADGRSERLCDIPCQNDGVCVAKDTCRCVKNWYGPTCTLFECTESCINGRCNGPDMCFCNSGWSGSTCSKPICNPACINKGQCVAPNECQCSDGYVGQRCQDATCDPPCGHGNCFKPNQCTCDPAWQGSLCTEPFCSSSCENGGECTGPNQCTCSADWRGYTCEIPVCRSRCLNGGTCVAPGECKCRPRFVGDSCQIALDKEAHSGYTCTVWGSYHFRTFDGHAYDFPGLCRYNLVYDIRDGLFTIQLIKNREDFMPGSDHYTADIDGHGNSTDSKIITETIQNYTGEFMALTLTLRGVSTTFTLLPSKLILYGNELIKDGHFAKHGVSIQTIGRYLRVRTRGVTILWDGDGVADIEFENDLYRGSVGGLCGNFDTDPHNDIVMKDGTKATDLLMFAMAWRVKDAHEDCADIGDIPVYCSNHTSERIEESRVTCHVLISKMRSFKHCRDRNVDPMSFTDACITDLCKCKKENRVDCCCNALTQYSRLCAHETGIAPSWRTQDLCGVNCPFGMVYDECASSCPRTCQSLRTPETECDDHCMDGCTCANGTVLRHDNVCVREEDCPCKHGDSMYPAGHVIHLSCQDCKCAGALWDCKTLQCPGECSVVGDSHYTTYDGLLSKIYGECQFTLVKDCSETDMFSVIIENSLCADYLTKNCINEILISVSPVVGGPGTARTSSAMNGHDEIKIRLGRKGRVTIGDQDIALPLIHDQFQIFEVSSEFIQLRLDLGITINWDGMTRLYVHAERKWMTKLCGICGNFNENKKDDMMNFNGLVEKSATAFSNLWKVNSDCRDATPDLSLDPCVSHPKRAEFAKEKCRIIRSEIFRKCHPFVNPEEAEMICRQDVCQCDKGTECLCNSIAHYARQCSKMGQIISWRTEYLCPVICTGGQTYQQCGSSCQSTCRSISDPKTRCSEMCVEGCNCPPNLYLNEYKVCVAKTQCQCYHSGKVYQPFFILRRAYTVCHCRDGHFVCHNAENGIEGKSDAYVFNGTHCANGWDFRSCGGYDDFFDEYPRGVECQRTCKNLDSKCIATECVEGCGCPEGSVLDTEKNVCIDEDQCPCYYSGLAHYPGEVIKVDCNSCQCRKHEWICTEELCVGTCTTYGDPHYETFDGYKLDFMGQCGYILTQDYCGSHVGRFRVYAENMNCGSQGVSCAKSVTITLTGNIFIKLNKDTFGYAKKDVVTWGALPGSHSNVTSVLWDFHQVGLFTIVTTNIGLTVIWDKKTTLYIKLDPKYKGRVCGLCGDFDGNQNNDMMMSDHMLAINSAEFGNSWKVTSICADALKHDSECNRHPQRRLWAQRNCKILYDPVFSVCHSVIDVVWYHANCVFDACSCDGGGDCECLCTAIAAYAYACSEQGVKIRWRTANVCPLMCESYDENIGDCTWHYNECGSACPKTCEHRYLSKGYNNCPLDVSCVEGCFPNCPNGTLFDEASRRCVKECREGCHVSGRFYDYGEVVSRETCQVCTCEAPGEIDCRVLPECITESSAFTPTSTIYSSTSPIPEATTSFSTTGYVETTYKTAVLDWSVTRRYCSGKVNLGFLLDVSFYVSPEDFEHVKTIMSVLLQSIMPNNFGKETSSLKVAIEQYGTEVEKTTDFDNHQNVASLMLNIRDIELQNGYNNILSVAMKDRLNAYEKLAREQEQKNSTKYKIESVLFIILFSPPDDEFVAAAKSMKDIGVRIIILSSQSGPSELEMKQKLGDQFSLHYVDNIFDFMENYDLAMEVLQELCEGHTYTITETTTPTGVAVTTPKPTITTSVFRPEESCTMKADLVVIIDAQLLKNTDAENKKFLELLRAILSDTLVRPDGTHVTLLLSDSRVWKVDRFISTRQELLDEFEDKLMTKIRDNVLNTENFDILFAFKVAYYNYFQNELNGARANDLSVHKSILVFNEREPFLQTKGRWDKFSHMLDVSQKDDIVVNFITQTNTFGSEAKKTNWIETIGPKNLYFADMYHDRITKTRFNRIMDRVCRTPPDLPIPKAYCKGHTDVYFLWDDSNAISASDLKNMMLGTRKIAGALRDENFGDSEEVPMRVAIAEYSNSSKFLIKIEDQEKLKYFIDESVIETSQRSMYTDSKLGRALSEIRDQFDSTKGDRNRTVVIFTSKSSSDDFVQSIEDLRDLKTKIVIIGFTEQTNVKELKEISGEDGFFRRVASSREILDNELGIAITEEICTPSEIYIPPTTIPAETSAPVSKKPIVTTQPTSPHTTATVPPSACAMTSDLVVLLDSELLLDDTPMSNHTLDIIKQVVNDLEIGDEPDKSRVSVMIVGSVVTTPVLIKKQGIDKNEILQALDYDKIRDWSHPHTPYVLSAAIDTAGPLVFELFPRQVESYIKNLLIITDRLTQNEMSLIQEKSFKSVKSRITERVEDGVNVYLVHTNNTFRNFSTEARKDWLANLQGSFLLEVGDNPEIFGNELVDVMCTKPTTTPVFVTTFVPTQTSFDRTTPVKPTKRTVIRTTMTSAIEYVNTTETVEYATTTPILKPDMTDTTQYTTTSRPPITVTGPQRCVLDVEFIVDSSYSIQPAFEHIKIFLKKVIQQFDVESDAVRIGIVEYSGRTAIRFQLNDHIGNVTEMNKAIDGMTLMEGTTNTYSAIEYVLENELTETSGRRSDVPLVILLLTDGRIKDSDKKDEVLKKLEKERSKIEKRGDFLNVIVIGFGSAEVNELREISDNDMFLDNTEELEHEKFIENISNRSCVYIPSTTILTTIPTTTVLPVCSYMEPTNVLFVLDGSFDIMETGVLDVYKNFLKELSSKFVIGNSNTQVGVSFYADTAYNAPPYGFVFMENPDLNSLLESIDNLELTPRMTVDFVGQLDDIISNAFIGARRGVRKVAVVLLINEIYDPEENENLEAIFQQARDNDIEIITLLGSISSDANRALAKSVGLYVENSNKIKIDGGALELMSVLDVIQEKVCGEPPLTTPVTSTTKVTSKTTPVVLPTTPVPTFMSSTLPEFTTGFTSVEIGTTSLVQTTEEIVSTATPFDNTTLIPACESMPATDIVFVIDGARGLGMPSREDTYKTFLEKVVNNLVIGPDKTQISIETYGKKTPPGDETVEPAFDSHGEREDVSRYIKEWEIPGGYPDEDSVDSIGNIFHRSFKDDADRKTAVVFLTNRLVTESNQQLASLFKNATKSGINVIVLAIPPNEDMVDMTDMMLNSAGPYVDDSNKIAVHGGYDGLDEYIPELIKSICGEVRVLIVPTTTGITIPYVSTEIVTKPSTEVATTPVLSCPGDVVFVVDDSFLDSSTLKFGLREYFNVALFSIMSEENVNVSILMGSKSEIPLAKFTVDKDEILSNVDTYFLTTNNKSSGSFDYEKAFDNAIQLFKPRPENVRLIVLVLRTPVDPLNKEMQKKLLENSIRVSVVAVEDAKSSNARSLASQRQFYYPVDDQWHMVKTGLDTKKALCGVIIEPPSEHTVSPCPDIKADLILILEESYLEDNRQLVKSILHSIVYRLEIGDLVRVGIVSIENDTNKLMMDFESSQTHEHIHEIISSLPGKGIAESTNVTSIIDSIIQTSTQGHQLFLISFDKAWTSKNISDTAFTSIAMVSEKSEINRPGVHEMILPDAKNQSYFVDDVLDVICSSYVQPTTVEPAIEITTAALTTTALQKCQSISDTVIMLDISLLSTSTSVEYVKEYLIQIENRIHIADEYASIGIVVIPTMEVLRSMNSSENLISESVNGFSTDSVTDDEINIGNAMDKAIEIFETVPPRDGVNREFILITEGHVHGSITNVHWEKLRDLNTEMISISVDSILLRSHAPGIIPYIEIPVLSSQYLPEAAAATITHVCELEHPTTPTLNVTTPSTPIQNFVCPPGDVVIMYDSMLLTPETETKMKHFLKSLVTLLSNTYSRTKTRFALVSFGDVPELHLGFSLSRTPAQVNRAIDESKHSGSDTPLNAGKALNLVMNKVVTSKPREDGQKVTLTIMMLLSRPSFDDISEVVSSIGRKADLITFAVGYTEPDLSQLTTVPHGNVPVDDIDRLYQLEYETLELICSVVPDTTTAPPTTTVPTTRPKIPCKVDVMFMADEELFTSEKSVQIVDTYLKTIGRHLVFGDDFFRVGVKKFSEVSTDIVPNGFANDFETLQNDLDESISVSPLTGSLNLHAGLKSAQSDFKANGRTGKDVSRLVIFVLRRRAIDSFTAEELQRLRDEGVMVFTVVVDDALSMQRNTLTNHKIGYVKAYKLKYLVHFASPIVYYLWNSVCVTKSPVKLLPTTRPPPITAPGVCSKPLDITYLVDSNLLVSEYDKENTKYFIKDTMRALDLRADKTRVSVVQFGSIVSPLIDLRDVYDIQAAFKAVDSKLHLPYYHKDENSFLSSALFYAAKYILRADGVRDAEKLIVLLTAQPFNDDDANLKTLGEAAKKMDIGIVTISNTSVTNEQIDLLHPRVKFDYDTIDDLSGLVSDIVTVLCEFPTTTPAITTGVPYTTSTEAITTTGFVVEKVTHPVATTPDLRRVIECSTLKLDLMIMLQATNYFSKFGSEQMKSFANALSKSFRFGPDNVLTSVLQFNGHVLPIDKLQNGFNFKYAKVPPLVTEAIFQLHVRGADETSPGPALSNAIEKYLTSDQGAREGIRKAIVMLVGGNIKDDSVYKLNKAIRAAVGSNHSIFLIGIPEGKDNVERTDSVLKNIHQLPTKNKILARNGFDDLSNRTMIQILSNEICQDLPYVLPEVTTTPLATTQEVTTKIPIDTTRIFQPTPTSSFIASTEAVEVCVYESNIAFVVDTVNMPEQDLNSLKEFLKRIVRKFEISQSDTQIALVTYGTTPSIEYGFTDDQSLSSVMDKIDNITASEKFTMTGAALQTTAGVFDNGRPDVPRIVVLITNARSKDDIGLGVSALDHIKSTHEAGLKKVAVGLSSFSPAQLEKFADDNSIVHVDSYENLLANNSVESVFDLICSPYEEPVTYLPSSTANFTSIGVLPSTTVRMTTIGLSSTTYTELCDCHWSGFIESGTPMDSSDFCKQDYTPFEIKCQSSGGFIQSNMNCTLDKQTPVCYNFEVVNGSGCLNYSMSFKCCSEHCGEPPLFPPEPKYVCEEPMDIVFALDTTLKNEMLKSTKLFVDKILSQVEVNQSSTLPAIVTYGSDEARESSPWTDSDHQWKKALDNITSSPLGTSDVGKVLKLILEDLVPNSREPEDEDIKKAVVLFVTGSSIGIIDGLVKQLENENFKIVVVGLEEPKKILAKRLTNDDDSIFYPETIEELLEQTSTQVLDKLCGEEVFTTTRPAQPTTTPIPKTPPTSPLPVEVHTAATRPVTGFVTEVEKFTENITRPSLVSAPVTKVVSPTTKTVTERITQPVVTTVQVTTTPGTTKEPFCIYFNDETSEKRKLSVGEVIFPDHERKCFSLECAADNDIKFNDKRMICENLEKPGCKNGMKPVLHFDDSCNCQWECQCYCQVSSNVFYSYDGLVYNNDGECDYVLTSASKRASRMGRNFSVSIRKEKCGSDMCITKVSVTRLDSELTLYNNFTVFVDGSVLHVDDVHDTFKLSLIGHRKYIVVVEDIDLELQYEPETNGISVMLPSYQWEDNTEGLCGTCNHVYDDELTLGNGTVADNVTDFVRDWQTNDKCNVTKEEPCVSELEGRCELIKNGSMFKECRDALDWERYYDSCVEELCRQEDSDLCDVLSGFAEVCRQQGVCVEWRTEDICSMNCSGDGEYKPCAAPPYEKVCENKKDQRDDEPIHTGQSNKYMEGCYRTCGENEVVIDGACVAEKYCNSCYDTKEKIFRETGVFWAPKDQQCSVCSCHASNLTIVCEERSCVNVTESPTCGKCEKLNIKAESDPCCPEYECVCDHNKCAPLMPTEACQDGESLSLVSNASDCQPIYNCTCDLSTCEISHSRCDDPMTPVEVETSCCPKSECRCPENCDDDDVICVVGFSSKVRYDICNCSTTTCDRMPVCVVKNENQTVIKSEKEKWTDSNDPCLLCQCDKLENEDGTEVTYDAKCNSVAKSCKECAEGFTATDVADECCDKCEPSACIVLMTNNETTVHEVGDVWAGDVCQNLTCVKKENQYIVAEVFSECNKTVPSPCQFGYSLKCNNDPCCPECHCVPEEVCIYNGSILHKPGNSWTIDVCTTCKCTDDIEEGGFYEHECTTTHCAPCDEEHLLHEIEGTCCGECLPTVCKVDVKNVNGTKRVSLNISEELTHNCQVYNCVADEDGKAILTNTTVNCPKFDQDECVHLGGTVTKDESGCCATCEFQKIQCQVRSGNKMNVTVGKCELDQPVVLPYCEGQCSSSVHFHSITGDFIQHCSCCKPVSYENRTADATCIDGSKIEVPYRYVTECSCERVVCAEWKTASDSVESLSYNIMPEGSNIDGERDLTKSVIASWKSDDKMNVIEISDIENSDSVDTMSVVQEVISKYDADDMSLQVIRMSANNSTLRERLTQIFAQEINGNL